MVFAPTMMKIQSFLDRPEAVEIVLAFDMAIVLVAIVCALTLFSKMRAGAAFFRYLPVPFYCYFIPILGATFGILPQQSILYKFLSQHVLPPCLVLLLLGSPWADLSRVGRQAILAMFIGTLGMMSGAVAGYVTVGPWLPADSWMAAGSAASSNYNGSATAAATSLRFWRTAAR